MTETDAENWAIFEEAMFMLQDVPGETLLERVARLSKWYLDMQMELGSVKHKLEVSEAVNRLTAPAQQAALPVNTEALALADRLAKMPMYYHDHQGGGGPYVEIPDDMRVDLFSVLRSLAQAEPDWCEIGSDGWLTLKHQPVPAQAAPTLQYVIEGIILRRLHEKRIEGYTIEMAKEIAEAFALPSTERQPALISITDDGRTVFEDTPLSSTDLGDAA